MADANFSSLEVAQPGLEPVRTGEHVPVEQDKLVVIADVGKQVVPGGGLEAINVQKLPIDQHSQGSTILQKQNSRRKRKWILLGGAIVLIVGAVVGGVLGGLKPRHSSRTSIPAATTSNGTTMSNGTSTSNGTIAGNSTSPSNSTTTHIAAVAFEWESMNNTKLYYQSNGSIFEASNSTSGTGWTSKSIAGSRNISLDSNLAAAVSRPEFPLVSNFFMVWGFA